MATPPNPQKQFFPTIRQRARKRQCNDVGSANYFAEKSALLASENKRRDQMHAIELEIKQEELLTKRKINAFWDLASEKLQSCDNIATAMQTITAAKTMQTISAAVGNDSQTMDLADLEIEYINEPYADEVADNTDSSTPTVFDDEEANPSFDVKKK